MVLQRDQPDKVYGTAEPGEEVSVSIADQTKTTKADDKGRWSVTLDPLKTSTKPLTMTVKGKNTVTFDDVLVGEVWICSGQSNMGFNLGSAYDADIEALTAKIPNLTDLGASGGHPGASGRLQRATGSPAPRRRRRAFRRSGSSLAGRFMKPWTTCPSV